MNKIIVLAFTIFYSLLSMAQAPDRISYQAAIRNTDNTALANTQISLKILLLQESIGGNTVYEEIHHPITTINGIVSIEIGGGVSTKGDFSDIDWSMGPYFIQTLVDINGGSTYALNGTSQLLSVPYALHSKTAESIAGSSGFSLKSEVVPFTLSRSITSADINNIIECTTSATLNLTENFNTMLVGDVVNLEAHNGAVLTLKAASGVQLNYTVAGTAQFASTAGNVRFGLLRKIGANAYIISGQ